MKFNKKQKQWLGIIIGIILVGIILSQTGLLKNLSILSQSDIKVNFDGEKAFWVITATANKNGDTFGFIPKVQTSPDGSTITPKNNFVLAMSKVDTSCNYRVTLVEKKMFLVYTYKYYILSNPEREAKVIFTDGNNKQVTMDGSLVDSVVIPDKDNTGELTIETQGLLLGKSDCPEVSNVVIQPGENGNIIYRYKNEVDTFISSSTALNFISNLRNLRENTQFTQPFSSTPTILNGILIGKVDIGNVLLTITADQDYFDSVVYTPPKTAKPEIVSIDAPNEVLTDGSSSLKVTLKNKNSESGLVSVKASSSIFGLSGNKNVQLSSSEQVVSFSIKAPNEIKCGNIDISACGVSQFGSADCDSDSVNICTISDKEDIKEYCGDNICQPSESYNDCPSDCYNRGEDCIKEGEECGFFNNNCCEGSCKGGKCTSLTSCQSCDDSVKSALLGWMIKSQKCEKTLTQKFTGCIISWFKGFFVLIVFIFSNLFGYDLLNNLLRKNIRKEKLRIIVSLILSLSISVGLGFLLFSLLSSPLVWVIGFVYLIVVIAFRLIIGNKITLLKKGLKSLR